jgi:hypothetical protein
MTERFTILDGGALENLFSAGGTEAWDSLLTGSRRLVIFDEVLKEIDKIPSTLAGDTPSDPRITNPNAGLRAKFETWMAGKNSIIRIDTFPPADSIVNKSDFDRAVDRFMKGEGTDAIAARTSAGIPNGPVFELITDDRKWLEQINKNTGFNAKQLADWGHAIEPYPGSFGFLQSRYANGHLTAAEYDAMVDKFRESHRFTGKGTATGLPAISGKPYGGGNPSLRDIVVKSDELVDPSLLTKIRALLDRFVNDQAGSVSPEFAIRGGAFAGALGILAKFGVIGDVLAFSMVATRAEELREAGEIKKANKLWTAYFFETAGGFAGGAVGASVAVATLKGFGGFWGPLIGVVAGSLAGSYAGAQLGEFVYDRYPDIFDDVINAAYDGVGGEYSFSVDGGVDFTLKLFQKFGFTLDATGNTAGEDWFVATKWSHLSGGKGDDLLFGWKPQFVAGGQTFDENIAAQATAAWAAYDALVALGQTPEPPAFERTAGVATTDLRQVLDGGEGNDWVIAVGGEKAVTVGGLGKDWIYNTSKGGEIWGDVKGSYKGADGQRYYNTTSTDSEGAVIVTPRLIVDDKSNSDNFWWSGGTTIKDAGTKDVLKFFGIALVGGDDGGGA